MSVKSERKRRQITLALGAVSALTFGGLYGMIVRDASPSSPAAAVSATVETQNTALTLAADDDGDDEEGTIEDVVQDMVNGVVPIEAPAPAPAPAIQAPVHATTRSS